MLKSLDISPLLTGVALYNLNSNFDLIRPFKSSMIKAGDMLQNILFIKLRVWLALTTNDSEWKLNFSLSSTKTPSSFLLWLHKWLFWTIAGFQKILAQRIICSKVNDSAFLGNKFKLLGFYPIWECIKISLDGYGTLWVIDRTNSFEIFRVQANFVLYY